jgi:hypothetical protein
LEWWQNPCHNLIIKSRRFNSKGLGVKCLTKNIAPQSHWPLKSYKFWAHLGLVFGKEFFFKIKWRYGISIPNFFGSSHFWTMELEFDNFWSTKVWIIGSFRWWWFVWFNFMNSWMFYNDFEHTNLELLLIGCLGDAIMKRNNMVVDTKVAKRHLQGRRGFPDVKSSFPTMRSYLHVMTWVVTRGVVKPFKIIFLGGKEVTLASFQAPSPPPLV